MATIKSRKITRIIREFVKTGDSYDITGINLGIAKFLWRVSQDTFQDLATGDYRIDQSNGKQTLVIVNQELLGKAEAFQVGYVLDFTASPYDTEWNVDINQLKDKYNTLVNNMQSLWEYIRITGMIADDSTIDLILPQLDVDQIWVRGPQGYYALGISDFRDIAGEALSDYIAIEKKNINQINKDTVNSLTAFKENTIKDITNFVGRLETAVTTGTLELRELVDALKLEVTNYINLLLTDTDTKLDLIRAEIAKVPAKIVEIQAEGATQKTAVKTIGSLQVEKVNQEGNNMITQIQGVTQKSLEDIGALEGEIVGTGHKVIANLEEYLVNAENGGNAEYLQGYAPSNFDKVEGTIASLQASRKYKLGEVVEVLGYYTAGDGAHHKRKIESTDDGSGVQLANGLWANIVHNGEVNVSWFGAKGDGVTDDSLALLRCFDTMHYGIVNFNGGTHVIHETDYTHVTQNLIFSNGVLAKPSSLLNGSLTVNGNGACIINSGVLKGGQYRGILNFHIDESSNKNISLSIKDITIDGNRHNISSGVMSLNYGIAVFMQQKNLKKISFNIDSCVIKNTGDGLGDNSGDGFYFWGGSCINSCIHGCSFINNGRWHITFESFSKAPEGNYIIENLQIINNQFTSYKEDNETLSSPKLGMIDFEIHAERRNITISDNKFNTYNRNSIANSFMGTQDLTFSRNIWKTSSVNNGGYNAFFNSGNLDGLVMEDNLFIISSDTSPATPFNFTDARGRYIIRNNKLVSDSVNSMKVIKDTSSDLEILFENNDGISYLNNPEHTIIKTYNYRDPSKGIWGTGLGTDIYSNISELNSGSQHFDFFSLYGRVSSKFINIKGAAYSYNYINFMVWNGVMIVDANTIINTQETILDYNFDIKAVTSGVVGNIASWLSTDVTVKPKFDGSNYTLVLLDNNDVYRAITKSSDYVSSDFAQYPSYTSGENFIFKNVNFEYVGKMAKLELIGGNIGKSDAEIIQYFNSNNYIITKGTTVTTKSATLTYVWDGTKFVRHNTAIIYRELNTPYHATKMQQEGVYEDFVSYMDSKTEFDRLQRELEQQRQLAFEQSGMENYEEWLAEQPMLLPVTEEPQPSEALLKFKEKYLG